MIVLDGYGLRKQRKGNAVLLAKTPFLHSMLKVFPSTELNVSGENVGLPKGSQGNSEVGHLHLGAGRIVWQPLALINKKIEDKTFFKNKVLIKAINHAKKNNSSLHLIGLCSDAGVHASINHLHALLKLAKLKKFKKVFIHCILDGRDVPEKSAKKFIKKILSWTKKLKIGIIASIIGRYYAMDRDNNWNRTKKAFDLLVNGIGRKEENPLKAIENAYALGASTDYYVEPIILTEKGLIKDKDSIIFFNFRTDRARQLTKAFLLKKFSFFKRKKLKKIFFVSFTEYDKTIKCNIAFKQEKVKNNLAIVLAKNNLKQLRIAETEKYAHVTFFFNSQVEKPVKGEKRILIKSPKVKSYDLKPEMSALKITARVLKELNKNYDFILINFANPDLVGHSGKIKAVIKALEVLDECVKKIKEKALKKDYCMIITADHGNAEEMLYPNGIVCPSHTTNKVPFVLICLNNKIKLRKGNAIDVAPTILELFGLKKPKEMTGKSLIRKI